MKCTLADVAKWTGGRIERGDPLADVADVTVDSRALISPNTLFVALQGPRFDGHHFVDQAFEKGATAALIHRGTGSEYAGEGALVIVDDTLEALQKLAASWRARFSIPFVGITGSNGKTIVKDMLASIVGRHHTVFRSPGSYNSQVGVPLSLLGLSDEHQVAIIEAGISQTGEMESLERMIRPTVGIVTNIGLAHAAGLNDEETTAFEKKKLFRRTEGPVVVPADEPLLARDCFDAQRLPVAFGDDESSEAEVFVEELHSREGGHDFRLRWSSERTVDVRLNVPGRHNVTNAAMAAAMAAHLGCTDEAIAQGLAAYSLRQMRLEMHTTGADITLINDAYNADPTSVRSALATLDNYAGDQRRIAILGDMLDLGGRSERAHRDVGRHLARLGVDRLFCIGELARHIGDGAAEAGMDPEAIDTVDDFDALNRRLDRELQAGDVVLFKASRAVGLDRAARRLIESVAPTRLYIDLNAIADNFHSLRRHLGDDVDVMAVVKSFGYGNDATRISQTLVQQGVDALAVAFPDEAIPLRRRGLTVPILVTNARAAEADKLVKYDLEALVYTASVARALAHHARKRNRQVGIHLAIDTGMRRAGLRPEQAVDFAVELTDTFPNLHITGLMTHFAVADMPAHDDFTRRQIARLEDVARALAEEGIEPRCIHAANTAAAWRFPEAHFDMVRVGLGLYGLHPSPAVGEEAGEPVRPALRFTTRVLHIHDVDKGESVGYGRTWRAPRCRRLATLAAGYNDGFPYFLSNRGQVLINGRRCPVVGSVCMDVTVVDITDAGDVCVGDEAVLFGQQGDSSIHVDEWARTGNTINYELLCNISPRVRRIFLK